MKKTNCEPIKKFLESECRTREYLVRELGVSMSMISKIFSNGYLPRLETLQKLAKLIKCKIKDLIIEVEK